MVRQLEGYNRIAFPHCACDSRKGGDVLLSVVFENLSLRACDINGQLQVSLCRLYCGPADEILTYECDF